MNSQDWDDLYRKLYDAYSSSILKDEYVRSSLADALDHMILLKNPDLKTPWTLEKLAHTP
tara:strand:+ start:286 stop:465 length:180 start_codon:yes stop_codon:yes gene_type:complete